MSTTLVNTCILSAKNAYALVHARLCSGAAASVPGYRDFFDQQFYYGGEFGCSVFFLSQYGEVHLIDLLEEFFNGGEGGQGFFREGGQGFF